MLPQLTSLACEHILAGDTKILLVRLKNANENYTFSEQVVNDFLSLFGSLDFTEPLAALILTGSDRFFCTGGDLEAMHHRRAGLFAGTSSEITEKYQKGIQLVIHTLYNLPIPTIAAINGAAIGAGLGLALACDFRYATHNATLAESFTRIGLVAGDGDCWLLPRIVGMANAMALLLTGDFIDASKALTMGLVNAVSEKEVLPLAMETAKKIANNSVQATRAMKWLLRESMKQNFEISLEQAAQIQGELHLGEDHQARVAALLNKIRNPL